MAEDNEAMLVIYHVEAWVKPGYVDTVREDIERALGAEIHCEDFGVDVAEDHSRIP